MSDAPERAAGRDRSRARAWRHRAAGACALAPLFLGACGAARTDLRERPVPIPYVDTLPIHEPEERTPSEVTELLKGSVKDEIGYALALDRRISGKSEALNLTPFDDVVPSSWYEARITERGMTPAALSAGPPGADPDTTGGFEVVDAKVGGVSPGFTVRDRKGDRYLLKFDPPGNPGLASGANVIVSRLFWAAGFHVPRDVLVTLDPSRLRIAEGTMIETPRGERPMVPADIQEILDALESRPDGTYRALASQFVPGVPKGPFLFEDTREDDPNDYYPHEDRRELRGLWVMAAWTDHVDLRFQNTLDVWIDPPGYLRHYLIDFGATLGSRSIRIANAREGREFSFDLGATLARTLTLGAYRAGWEGIDDRQLHPAVGWIATDSFDPAKWKPFWPNEAWRAMTVRDGYWGAKLVGAFERAHLEALVEEARYGDPMADSIILDALILRQRKVLRHWYGKVTPLEDVALSHARGATAGGPGAGETLTLSFADLGLSHDLWTARETRYAWSMRDEEGRLISEGEAPAQGSGRQEIGLPPPGENVSSERSPVRTLEVTALRSGTERRPARIHFTMEGGIARVVGMEH